MSNGSHEISQSEVHGDLIKALIKTVNVPSSSLELLILKLFNFDRFDIDLTFTQTKVLF